MTIKGPREAHCIKMLPECDVQFDHINNDLREIKQTVHELADDVREVREVVISLPVTIADSMRQHTQDCPSYQRAMLVAQRIDRTSRDVNNGMADQQSRIPRWLWYLIGGTVGGGGGALAILRALGVIE